MTPARNAELALLLEVAGTPKPGNVDRQRDHDDLRFEHFLAGAVGSADGLAAAAAGEPVGPSFERAVGGMAAAQSAGNTQFGALALLVPLVRAAAAEALTPTGVATIVDETTVDDAVAFCRAFDHVSVAVGDPPEDLTHIDVRDPMAAAAAVDRAGMTLAELMARSAAVDGVAREWTTGFERSFGAARSITAATGSAPDRAAEAYLQLLAERPDPFVARQHGPATAASVCERAGEAVRGPLDPAAFGDELVEAGVNPGTTADIVGAGLFVALERGLSV